jgi:hypothetical protein
VASPLENLSGPGKPLRQEPPDEKEYSKKIYGKELPNTPTPNCDARRALRGRAARRSPVSLNLL